MPKKYYSKIHFETITEASSKIVQLMFNKKGTFCEVIDELEEHITNMPEIPNFNAFIHDNACVMYLEEMFKKLKNSSVFKEGDEKLKRAAFWEIFLPYLFSRYGKKVFRLSKELVHMLIDTDLKKVDSFFLELPYKCIYISIPKEVKLINTFNLPIDGFYISILKNNEVNYKNLSPKYHCYQNAENTKSLMIVAVSDVLLKKGDPRDSMYYWHVILTEGDILQQLKEYVKLWMKEIDLAQKNIDGTFILNIFSFVVNTILYINSSSTSLVNTKVKISNVRQPKSTKKKKKALQRTKLPYYSLGTDIVIDHNYQKVINFSDKKEKDYRKHIKKWMVRGHWRNQPVGPGRNKRKLIWIQPYVKGEGFPEFPNKEYIVK